MKNLGQLDLFDFCSAYTVGNGMLSNKQMYRLVEHKTGMKTGELDADIDERGINTKKRTLRWLQQNAKRIGLLERVPERRGYWRLTGKGEITLTENTGKVSLVAFSSELGVMVWSACRPLFSELEEEIAVCITSPPYLIKNSRAYGGETDEQAYIDFVLSSLEPIVARLKRGGSIALNITNDAFVRGVPARSMYREKLLLALHEKLGLFKVDELIWASGNKPPTPTQWACKQRFMLKAAYEPIYHLTNDPDYLTSNNERVLEPHCERMLAYHNRVQTDVVSTSDGAYVRRPTSFRANGGRIPNNVIQISSTCASQREYKAKCREAGLPAHGAPMPLALAKFLVRYLSKVGELVCDPFAGSATTLLAAEQEGRRWIGTDLMLEYCIGSKLRFSSAA